MLPKDYASWESVYYYFLKWKGDVGYDGCKRTKGRKRHIVEDTLGLGIN